MNYEGRLNGFSLWGYIMQCATLDHEISNELWFASLAGLPYYYPLVLLKVNKALLLLQKLWTTATGQQNFDTLVKMFSRPVGEGPGKALDVEIPGIFVVSFWLVITATLLYSEAMHYLLNCLKIKLCHLLTGFIGRVYEVYLLTRQRPSRIWSMRGTPKHQALNYACTYIDSINRLLPPCLTILLPMI